MVVGATILKPNGKEKSQRRKGSSAPSLPHSVPNSSRRPSSMLPPNRKPDPPKVRYLTPDELVQFREAFDGHSVDSVDQLRGIMQSLGIYVDCVTEQQLEQIMLRYDNKLYFEDFVALMDELKKKTWVEPEEISEFDEISRTFESFGGGAERKGQVLRSTLLAVVQGFGLSSNLQEYLRTHETDVDFEEFKGLCERSSQLTAPQQRPFHVKLKEQLQAEGTFSTDSAVLNTIGEGLARLSSKFVAPVKHVHVTTPPAHTVGGTVSPSSGYDSDQEEPLERFRKAGQQVMYAQTVACKVQACKATLDEIKSPPTANVPLPDVLNYLRNKKDKVPETLAVMFPSKRGVGGSKLDQRAMSIAAGKMAAAPTQYKPMYLQNAKFVKSVYGNVLLDKRRQSRVSATSSSSQSVDEGEDVVSEVDPFFEDRDAETIVTSMLNMAEREGNTGKQEGKGVENGTVSGASGGVVGKKKKKRPRPAAVATNSKDQSTSWMYRPPTPSLTLEKHKKQLEEERKNSHHHQSKSVGLMLDYWRKKSSDLRDSEVEQIIRAKYFKPSQSPSPQRSGSNRIHRSKSCVTKDESEGEGTTLDCEETTDINQPRISLDFGLGLDENPMNPLCNDYNVTNSDERGRYLSIVGTDGGGHLMDVSFAVSEGMFTETTDEENEPNQQDNHTQQQASSNGKSHILASLKNSLSLKSSSPVTQILGSLNGSTSISPTKYLPSVLATDSIISNCRRAKNSLHTMPRVKQNYCSKRSSRASSAASRCRKNTPLDRWMDQQATSPSTVISKRLTTKLFRGQPPVHVDINDDNGHERKSTVIMMRASK